MAIRYQQETLSVDWEAMRRILIEDHFHNGRSAEQLQRSFEQSYAVVIAYDDEAIIGTARMLSDGVCNAYIVDMWTLTPYRRRGIGREVLRLLEARAPGQHICLWTEGAQDFYERCGYQRSTDTLYEKIVGQWLAG